MQNSQRQSTCEPAESGIGDYGGLMEQLGTQDWQDGLIRGGTLPTVRPKVRTIVRER